MWYTRCAITIIAYCKNTIQKYILNITMNNMVWNNLIILTVNTCSKQLSYYTLL